MMDFGNASPFLSRASWMNIIYNDTVHYIKIFFYNQNNPEEYSESQPLSESDTMSQSQDQSDTMLCLTDGFSVWFTCISQNEMQQMVSVFHTFNPSFEYSFKRIQMLIKSIFVPPSRLITQDVSLAFTDENATIYAKQKMKFLSMKLY